MRGTRRLPHILEPAQVEALMASLRTQRDRAMVQAMLLGALRRCEVLDLRLGDLHLGEWRVLVANGKGGHQRIVPVSRTFFATVAAYMNDERPADATTDRLFVVLKGPRRGQPLSAEGQPAYEVGGDSFNYAVNGDTLDFGVFDAMGHGLQSSQLAHLAVSSYRHSRRSGLDLEGTYQDMDAAVAARSEGEEYVTCIIGRLDLLEGHLTWINVGHPLPLLVRAGEEVGPLRCAPTLPAGLGLDGVTEIAHDVLQSGDRFFCITDGVVDSHRPGGEDFGQQRLIGLLSAQSRAGLDAAETVRQLSHTVLDHHGVLSDDSTAFLIDLH